MTKDEYGDFVLRYKGCGACFPMYHTLSRFEKMWFSAIQKDVATLEEENAELKNKLEHRNCLDCSNHSSNLRMRNLELEKENAELKKNCEDLKEFYEKEYFEIADRTADEKIKELEEYQTEVTVDDYSPYDENTWGMMHEEMFVPKELVRDLLKESYALSEHRNDQLTKAKELLKQFLKAKNSEDTYKAEWETEQFLKDCDIDNAIQQANKGLDFDKIADEMEQDLKDSEVEK